MKTPISLTPKAIEKIKNLVVHSGKYALKLDLKKGGCAGMEYSMQYVDAPEKNEEVTEGEVPAEGAAESGAEGTVTTEEGKDKSVKATDDKTKDKSAKPTDDKSKTASSDKGKTVNKETKKK